MACTSGNTGTVNVSEGAGNILTFVPATDGFPFEDPNFGTWSGVTWWVEELHFNGDVTTIGRTSSVAQPSFVTEVTNETTIASTGTKLAITFNIDKDLIPGGLTEVKIGVAATSSSQSSETTGQFCLTVIPPFSLVGENTVFAFTPSSIMASGGLLTTWIDATGNGHDMDTTDVVGTPTQPTVSGSTVVLDSNSDHRAATARDLLALNSDSYGWLVVNFSETGNGQPFAWSQQTGVDGGTATLFSVVLGAVRFQIAIGVSLDTSSLNDNVPHLIEVRRDITAMTPNVKLFVDGVQDGSLNTSDSMIMGQSNRTLAIGDFSGSNTCPRETLQLWMWDSDFPSAQRISEVREFCRDNLGCVNIP